MLVGDKIALQSRPAELLLRGRVDRDDDHASLLRRHIWRYCAIVAVVTAAVLSGVGLFLRHEHANARMLERTRLGEALASTAADTRHTISGVEAALAANVRRMLTLDASGLDIHVPAVADHFRDVLIERTASVPSVISMSILDSDGHWTISSRYRVIPRLPTNPKRPVWNAALRTDPSICFVFGPDATSAINMRSIGIGRSARASNGRMLGAALAFLSTDALGVSFKPIVSGGGIVSVSLPDGSPLFASSGNALRIPGWLREPWKRAVSRGGQTFEAVDGAGVAWLVAVSGTDDSAFVFTAMEPATIVSNARREYEATVMFATVIGLFIAAALFGLWMWQKRLTYLKGAAAIAAQQQLTASLNRDPATRLLNRVGFEKQLDIYGETKNLIAIHAVGIDRFPALAHALGHTAADTLLARLGKRLTEVIGQDDLASRLSGDEFCVAQYEGDPDYLARKLLWTLAEPYYVSGRELLLGVSVGVVDALSRRDWPQLLHDGSSAMDRARLGGVGQMCWFDAESDRALQERLLIEQELRSATGTDQLYMVYQPLYDLRSGAISGFEALMRWNNPKRGHVPPDLFIPIAEKAGILQPVDRMVRRAPLLAASTWPAGLRVSINCSAFEFRDRSLPERISQSLHRAGVSADRCCLEVTESALLEKDATVLAVMQELKDMGVRLALDDFGTGHASLSYLHRFPFDCIKIDRSFVNEMHCEPVAAAIVDATMALGKRLGIEIVAEGVETLSQLQHLREIGCDYVQGYFISRPLLEQDVAGFVERFVLAEGEGDMPTRRVLTPLEGASGID